MKKKIKLQHVKTRHASVREQQDVSDAHGRLVAAAQLESVVLLKTEAAFNANRLPDAGLENLELSVLAPEYRFSLSDNETVLFCGSRLVAIVTPPGAPVDREQAVVEVMGEYMLRYAIPSGLGCPAEAFTMFAGRNGVFNAWPFFRELVHSFGSKMDMPSLVLPLLRMPLSPSPIRDGRRSLPPPKQMPAKAKAGKRR